MSISEPDWGLPDPDEASEFYEGVPAKRLFAWIIDSVLTFGISLLLVPFTAFTAIFYFLPLWALVSLVYRIVTISRSSATPGMRLMAIEFRSFQGHKFDLTLAILHSLAYVVMFSIFIIQAVSIILMITNDRGQGLHDLILGTTAINRPAE
ncbi:MAG: RDD family protein [Mangrovicoccus sp.]